MSELHDSLLTEIRGKYITRGFVEHKTPMPTYRPDFFALKFDGSGKVAEEAIVEAEIISTLFSDHTTNQLILMDQYIRRKKGKVYAYLVVPDSVLAKENALMLLNSLFPEGTKIKVKAIKP